MEQKKERNQTIGGNNRFLIWGQKGLDKDPRKFNQDNEIKMCKRIGREPGGEPGGRIFSTNELAREQFVLKLRMRQLTRKSDLKVSSLRNSRIFLQRKKSPYMYALLSTFGVTLKSSFRETFRKTFFHIHGVEGNIIMADLSTMSKNDQPKRLPCRADVIANGDVQNKANCLSTTKKKSANMTNANCKMGTMMVRKGLGCRRSRKDMLSPEDQKKIEADIETQQHHCMGRGQAPRKPIRPVGELKPRRRLIFTSPRVKISDEDLFPSDDSLFREPSDRWQQISEQAGSHRQDGLVMNIGRRPSNAILFRMGMTKCAALRVRSINLWVDHEKDTLLDWLQMIAEVFVNLEHMTLTEDLFPGEDDMAVSARMRRLYVLSVLPNLKSIDEMVVTREERKMADPDASHHQRTTTSIDSTTLIDDPSLTNSVEEDDSRIAPMPVSISIDSIRSSRACGIEVEFLPEKCWDVKQTETETTASISPTSNSETTITATGSDDHFVFEHEETSKGTPIFTDGINESVEPEIDGISVNSDIDKDEGGGEVLKQIKPSIEKDNNQIPRSGYAHTGRMENHPKYSASSNSTHASDNLRNKVTQTKVRALHNDSNKGIELVPVASIDLGWSGTSDDSSSEQKKPSAPVLQLPLSETPREQIRKYQDSTKSSRNQGRLNACTPVQRQSNMTVTTPNVGCCLILRNDESALSQFSFPKSNRPIVKTKTFSLDQSGDFRPSANQKLPPSKSLSSPFPMQFRDRQKPPYMATSCHKVSATASQTAQTLFDSTNYGSKGFDSKRAHYLSGRNEIEVVVGPSPSAKSSKSSLGNATCLPKTIQKGGLPPPCPASQTVCKKAPYRQVQKRNSRHGSRENSNDILREAARAISVMDLEDDEEEFSDSYVAMEQKSI